jgi:hypothetical protein
MFTNEQEALNEHSDDTFVVAYNVNTLYHTYITKAEKAGYTTLPQLTSPELYLRPGRLRDRVSSLLISRVCFTAARGAGLASEPEILTLHVGCMKVIGP